LLRLAREVGDPTRAPLDPSESRFLERLHRVGPALTPAIAEPVDLYFLQPANDPDLLGRLDHYEVQQVIGQGGMGVVLKAFDPELRRLVAIKVMASGLAGSATARRRFKREAQAAAAVVHDHVVTVHGVNEASGLPYLVMQYVAGESLQERLDRTGPLELTEVVRIGLQTAQGLAAAHAQGLVHRDIKPANLLLEGGLARVKITDFGLARMVDDVGLTRDGVVTGTPEYMAPEQARGAAVDHRADLFSLGCVLYAACTGSPPFWSTTALGLLRQVSEQEPAPIRSRAPDVSAWLEALVKLVLAKDPADRLQSAAELARLLEGYLAHLRQPATVAAPKLPAPVADGGKRAALRLWQGALLLALVSLSVALYGWASGSGRELQKERGGELRERLVHDFRGRSLPAGMTPYGTLDSGFVRMQAEGLRITLPRDRTLYGEAGLALPLGIGGDFDITLTFANLRTDEPPPRTPSYGVGLLMSLNDTVRMGRLVRADGSEVVTWDRWVVVRGKPTFLSGASPTTARAGRLCLKRTGATLRWLWAHELMGDAFEEIYQCELAADVTLLRLELCAGNRDRPAALDVRLLDLKVLSSTPVAASIKGRSTRSWAWLLAAGAVLVVILSTLVVCLVVRPGRGTRKARPGSPRPDRQVGGEVTAPALSAPCSGCGKKLQARASLAGKRVRCPHCGQPSVVPAR
jgi:serine/threonine protein kinase